MSHSYFYDQQTRRYIQQFIRLFSGFSVEMGKRDDGTIVYQTVPVRYGDISRMAAHVLKENSENFMSAVPFISCYVTEFTIAPERRSNHNYKNTAQVYEKAVDPVTGDYIDGEVGNTYSVERYQPVPYNMTFNVDIWTSSTEQKLQLLEQILVLYNPSINIHTNSNHVDWTSLSYVELTNVTWSSRSIPQGIDDQLEIATLSFSVPIFISPPAKVQRQNLIHTIINQMHVTDTGDIDNGWDITENFSAQTTTHSIVTLEQYRCKFLDNKAIILNGQGGDANTDGGTLAWEEVLKPYGDLREGVSQIRFRRSNDVTDASLDIIGYLSHDINDPQKLIVTVDADTLPTNSQGIVDAIVDPQRAYPGDGNLPVAEAGQRYLVLEDLPGGSAWGGATAKVNDIIQYNGSSWIVSFDSSASTGSEYFTNTTDSNQYEWTGVHWQNSSEGVYAPGYWRLYL